MYNAALVLYIAGLVCLALATFGNIPRVNLQALGLFFIFAALFLSGAALLGDAKAAMDAVREATDPATWSVGE